MRTLAIVLLSTTAAAAPAHEVHFGSQVRALHAASANAVTDDSLAGPVLGYAHHLYDLHGTSLWATGEIGWGFVGGEMFQTLDTEVRTLQLAAGLRARRPLWREITAATARFELGSQRVGLALDDRAGHEASDRGWGAMSTAALGLELGYQGRSFGITFRFEVGYAFAQAVDLDARSPGAPDGTIELDRMAAAIGSLDLGGKLVTSTITTRF